MAAPRYFQHTRYGVYFKELVVPIAQVPVAHYMPVEGQNTIMTAGVPMDLVKQMVDRGKWENPAFTRAPLKYVRKKAFL
jgi:hypothetical protein